MIIFQSDRETSHIVNGYDDRELLFDPAIITTLDWSRHKATFCGDISPHKPGPNLLMRPLSVDDFDKGVHQICCCFFGKTVRVFGREMYIYYHILTVCKMENGVQTLTETFA